MAKRIFEGNTRKGGSSVKPLLLACYLVEDVVQFLLLSYELVDKAAAFFFEC